MNCFLISGNSFLLLLYLSIYFFSASHEMWTYIILRTLQIYIAIYMISPSPFLKLIIVISVVDSKISWQSRERKDTPSKSIFRSRIIYDIQLFFIWKRYSLFPVYIERRFLKNKNHITTLILNEKTKMHFEFSTRQFLPIKKNLASVKMECRMFA